jgi:MFS family permease
VGRSLFGTGTGLRQDVILTGTLFLLGLAVLVVGIAALALAATAATDHISYSALRRELREFEGERITPKQLADFRRRLVRIDARTRSRLRPTRVLLLPPNVLRLCSILVGVLVVVTAWVAQVSDPTARGESLALLSIVAPILNALFGALAIRFGITADAAWRRVYARQRVDILKLLEGFDRATRKKVAGLGDRVARALKILGEQQP